MAKRKSGLGRAIGITAAGLAVAAVVQELTKPAGQRTWHGQILYVPYDFRAPTADRLLASWWNPEDTRILTPRAFGLGWAVNIGRIVTLVRDRH